jgi:hypothetical protein
VAALFGQVLLPVDAYLEGVGVTHWYQSYFS